MSQPWTKLPLPPSLPFVGRAAELAALRALIPTATGEMRRVALVSGEPGSGKSRLVRELAREAAQGEVRAFYGSCDSVLTTPYEPFVESLSQLVEAVDPEQLRVDLGATGRELTRLLPHLPALVGELGAPLAAEPDTERYRLHMAVANLLTAVGQRGPVLLVIEDVHWADASTLHLLRHLVRASTNARLLLVITLRAGDPELGLLSETLADLARAEGVARLSVGGLSREEVSEFVRLATAGEVFDDLGGPVETITELTAGNPFLLCELWRMLVETEALSIEAGRLAIVSPIAELASPASVRDLVGGRVARLGSTTRELLEQGSVMGAEFELRVLAETAKLDESGLAAALVEAVHSGMIEEVAPVGTAYRFTHELVRRALSDGLSGPRRAELHLRAGQAFERAHTSEPKRFLPELAHHFAAAVPIADAQLAVDYNVRAARAAVGAVAHEDAADRLQVALSIGVEDERERATIELELGTALHRAGRSLEALDALGRVAAIARRIDEPELLARAAIGVEDACWRPGIIDRGADELLREALRALAGGDPSLRVRLLSGLSRALALLGQRDEAALVRAEAVDLARRLDDRQALAAALIGGYWARGSNPLSEVLDMLAEAVKLGDVTQRAEAGAWRVITFVQLADLDSARAELELVRAAAERTGQPFIGHSIATGASALALCEGRLDEAEAMAERAGKYAGVLRGPDASATYGMQLFNIRREQGRLGELAPVVRLLADDMRQAVSWRPGLVALLAELGMEQEARRELRRACEQGLPQLAQDALDVAGLTFLADATVALSEIEAAALLYPRLAALEGRPIVIGHLVACYGAADRYLGALAATLGEWDAAERHFEAALQLNQRMGADLWLAHTRYDYASMLRGRAGNDDEPRATALLAEAKRAARTIGMRTLATRIERLAAVAPSASQLPDDLSPREAAVLRLVAQGLRNREIGRTLVISEHTAANHVRSILRKTGCANRAEAAAYAYRHRVVER
ncbi:MAG: AAA family ATPase [Solirubrobacterales bacterium]|nr:AAA family ATPase [Solirubrobacterales bacterium]